MEAIMPSSLTQLIIGMAVATGMAVVSAIAIGSAASLASTVEQAQVNAPETLTGHYESPLSDADARLSDRQQLRRIFLDGSRDRLR
jgi:hypothetical protein